MAKTTLYGVLKLPWLLLCLCVLGLGLAAQQRFKRAVLFPVIMLCISAVFIALRLFSMPLGLMVFTVLLLVSYLVYWFDWLRFPKNNVYVRKSFLYSALFLFFSTASFIAFAYYSAAITGYRIYHIPSMSMAPNLLPGDYVLVDLWHYKKQLAKKGDIVVFPHPLKKHIYIKRIAKVPNDFFLNKRLTEKTYAVLGDNIDNSQDSRMFGAINHENLIGKASLIVFAIDYENKFNDNRFLFSL